MISALQGLEPLAKVAFIHDYIQLWFEEEIVTILNEPVLHMPDGRIITRQAVGFCDSLVALIGKSIADATLEEGVALSLEFANGVKLMVPLTETAARGPEAVELPRAYIIFNA